MGRRHKIEITDQIRELLKELLDKHHGATAEISRETGIPKDRLSKWSTRTTKTMTEEDYARIASVLNFQENREPTRTAQFKKELSSFPELFDSIASGKQIISGVINVFGIPVEKIAEAIRTSDLTEKQKQDLKDKIFS